MTRVAFHLPAGVARVAGSFGSLQDLDNAAPEMVQAACDIAEIRLDILAAEGGEIQAFRWAHLAGIPLLFTARRIEEGGALPMDAGARARLLESVLPDASWVDVEVASIPAMGNLLEKLAEAGIPWIASYHDFEKLPENAALLHAAKLARDAGAAVFKAAARVDSPADIARLAEFQRDDHGLPVATMGMGPLAPVSRLLCAQYGSVLNYGYLGKNPTAPGQWSASCLGEAITRLPNVKA